MIYVQLDARFGSRRTPTPYTPKTVTFKHFVAEEKRDFPPRCTGWLLD